MGSPSTLFLLAGAVLFALGVRGVLRDADPVRRIIAINVMGNGVFLILVAMAAPLAGERPDPVPHAMVLTGIVVAVCATALALTLADLCRRSDDDSGEEGPR